MTRPQPPGWIALFPVAWVIAWVVLIQFGLALVSKVWGQEAPPSVPVSVPMLCLPSAYVDGQLGSVGERVVAHGVTVRGPVMQIWAHPRTGTFSIVLRQPNGKSCLLVTGDDFDIGAPI